MKAWIWRRVTFDAAHQLPFHEGVCKRLHGHTYAVELGVLSTVDEVTGMGIDLIDLKEFLYTNVVARFDHRLLNDALQGVQPTAESIAEYVAETASQHFHASVRVRVYETPNSWVEVSYD